jgi:hypothetical protein
VKIQVTSGQAFWTYRGVGDFVFADLRRGEAISLKMTGLTSNYDPRTGPSLWFRGRATLMLRGPQDSSLVRRRRRES